MQEFWHNILSYLKVQFGTLDFNLLLNQLAYDKDSPLIFSSGMFMFMFAIFIVIYALLRKLSLARTLFVVAFSYYFYYKSSGIYFFLLAIVTCSDYIIGECLHNTQRRFGRKMLFQVHQLLWAAMVRFHWSAVA